MRERLVYLVTSFWLPLPFLTIRGVDRGTEKAEIWFLVVLHSVENVLIVSTSRLVYLQESYPLGIIIFDYVLVLLNLLGVIMTILYVYKVELYAGLSQQHCSLPSFSPEVSINMHCIQCFTQAQALIRTISGRPHWLSKYQSGGKHRGGQCKPRGTGGAWGFHHKQSDKRGDTPTKSSPGSVMSETYFSNRLLVALSEVPLHKVKSKALENGV